MTNKANTNSPTKRRIRATMLALAAAQGRGNGVNSADCVACGTSATVGLGANDPNRLEAGHNVSEANGGHFEMANLMPMCSACNDSLGSRNIAGTFIPKYDIHAGWNGSLVPDPGAGSRRETNRENMWDKA